MNHRQLFITSDETPLVTLRSIGEDDLEELRNWKNLHRFSFFFQNIITSEDQHRWFSGYCGRPDDLMLVVVWRARSVGCMGFRLLDNQIDIYNVIRGVPEAERQGSMGQALRLTCSYALSQYGTIPIRAKVLRKNPAITWYLRNGFVESLVRNEYSELELNQAVFRPCQGLRVEHILRPSGGM